MSFVDRYGRWTDQQSEAALEAEQRINTEQLEVIRLPFADQHGVCAENQ